MAKPKPAFPNVFLAASVPASTVEAIDDYRFALRLSSRSEALRRLVAAGLAAESQTPEAPPRARPKTKRRIEP